MKLLNTRNYSIRKQFIISIISVIITSISCFLSKQFLDYKTVALLLLVNVSIVAMLFDIVPVLVSAVLSALIWNFLFIPPILTFHIEKTEDLLMFLLYFIIAMINAVLTLKIRKEEKKSRDKEEKENIIQLYNTLLNSLTHELRTPISTIIGAVDNLKDNREKLTISHQVELLNQIDIASVRLNNQVENLLNMSRLETGILHLNLEWCDTNELIYGVINKFSFPYHQTIVFEPNENLPYFKFDIGLIEQVLHNIINNALLYTPENTVVTIVATEIANECVISISDNGNGIPEDKLKYIFDKFYRLPNNKAGGSGLGLSIVKGFIEAHNGKIIVENNNNAGVTFKIYLPAQASYLNNIKNE